MPRRRYTYLGNTCTVPQVAFLFSTIDDTSKDISFYLQDFAGVVHLVLTIPAQTETFFDAEYFYQVYMPPSTYDIWEVGYNYSQDTSTLEMAFNTGRFIDREVSGSDPGGWQTFSRTYPLDSQQPHSSISVTSVSITEDDTKDILIVPSRHASSDLDIPDPADTDIFDEDVGDNDNSFAWSELPWRSGSVEALSIDGEIAFALNRWADATFYFGTPNPEEMAFISSINNNRIGQIAYGVAFFTFQGSLNFSVDTNQRKPDPIPTTPNCEATMSMDSDSGNNEIYILIRSTGRAANREPDEGDEYYPERYKFRYTAAAGVETITTIPNYLESLDSGVEDTQDISYPAGEEYLEYFFDETVWIRPELAWWYVGGGSEIYPDSEIRGWIMGVGQTDTWVKEALLGDYGANPQAEWYMNPGEAYDEGGGDWDAYFDFFVNFEPPSNRRYLDVTPLPNPGDYDRDTFKVWAGVITANESTILGCLNNFNAGGSGGS